jgi:cytosine/adenosine deaminase-related metal-dependent hydrolase
MTPLPVVLRAAWVAPMGGRAPLRDGAVAMAAGCVVAVGPSEALRPRFPDADLHDLGDAVLLPGLVNAHVHLELNQLRCGDRPTSFVDWLLGLMRSAGPGDPASAAADGAAECLRFGVTAVGDITAFPAFTRPVVVAAGLAGVSYGEVRAMAARRSFLEPRIAAAAEPVGSDRLRAGISPHAPYSIELDGYRRCLAVAAELGLPIATHLAETVDEATFLADHAGPFRQLWAVLDAWTSDVPTFAGGPIRAAAALGLLASPRALLAHVNHADDAELALLAAGQASVVYCPRTHAYFGHRPHRWRDMLAAGVNVAVGTDSRASAPDLNLVDDLRLLRRLAPDVPAVELWAMATHRAARAIGRPDLGVLNAGAPGDAVAFPVDPATADPLADVLDGSAVPTAVWLAGRGAG